MPYPIRGFIFNFKPPDRKILRAWFVILIALAGSAKGLAQLERFSFTESKMGSPFTIVLYTDDSVTASKLAAKCYALTDSLVYILSDYIDSSELNRLCARAGAGYVSCSPVLYEILTESKKAFVLSKGKFDVSLGPLTRLWRKARKTGIFPDSVTILKTKAITGFDKIYFDTLQQAVFLTKPGMQLDLGGIGQGFIAGKVAGYLQQESVKAALVDVSGDIVAVGHPPGKKGWTIAINTPESGERLLPRHLLISDKAVTTSGDVYQFMVHDGKKYSHILDPGTGYGITSQRNVTVVAKDGSSADWLTKAFSLLPESAARRLAATMKSEFLITEIRGGRIRYFRSRNFDRYWKKVPR